MAGKEWQVSSKFIAFFLCRLLRLYESDREGRCKSNSAIYAYSRCHYMKGRDVDLSWARCGAEDPSSDCKSLEVFIK